MNENNAILTLQAPGPTLSLFVLAVMLTLTWRVVRNFEDGKALENYTVFSELLTFPGSVTPSLAEK
jgi:hypothetical protein